MESILASSENKKLSPIIINPLCIKQTAQMFTVGLVPKVERIKCELK